MSEDARRTAESIRQGTYFKEARGWYSAVYLSPISERTIFLVIALLSCAIAVSSLLALRALLPLKTHPALLISAGARAEEVIPHLEALKSKGVSSDRGVVSFLVSKYVESREGFSAAAYQRNAAFIRAQSDEPTYAAYSAQYSSANPQSPAAQLGENSTRLVEVDSVSLSSSLEKGSATVHFSTETTGALPEDKRQWTAKIDFHYTGIVVKEVKNPETGKPELQITDPTFQVVNYALTQD